MDTGPDHWWLVVAAGLAVFAAQLDTTIVTVALPTIAGDLGARRGSRSGCCSATSSR